MTRMVVQSQGFDVEFNDVTAWSVVSLGDLYIFKGDLPVAVFSRGQWAWVRRFDDGQVEHA